MRILQVSKFLHHVGGVETYVESLTAALRADGHDVACLGMLPPSGLPVMPAVSEKTYMTRTRDYHAQNRLRKSADALASIYSYSAKRAFARAVSEFRPDVVHFHGTCFQLTSSVFGGAVELGVPRIATLHEYKLVCANQRLWDDKAGAICTACVGAPALKRLAAPISRACIKGSRGASGLGAIEDALSNRSLRRDHALILHCPSNFISEILLQDGWMAGRIRTVDLPWPTMPLARPDHQKRLLYIGRLAVEKDVRTLLQAWAIFQRRFADWHLEVAGDGSEVQALRDYVVREGLQNVVFLGRLTRSEVEGKLSTAAATVHPAGWYENSPIAVRESLAAGVPCIIANRGGMPELLHEGQGVIVEHSVPGWAMGLEAFVQQSYDRVTLQKQIRSSRPDMGIHLTEILGLYREASSLI